MKTCGVSLARLLVNAICEPSGDHAGSVSSPSKLVTLAMPVPSALITQRSKPN